MKKCPNCGAMMAADVNFCTNCGEDIRSVSIVEENKETVPVSEKQEKTVENKAAYSQTEPAQAKQPTIQTTQTVPTHQTANYWNWLVSSWKNPMLKTDHEKWFGIVNLIAEIVLVTLSFWKMLQNGVNLATNAAGSAASSILGSEASKGISAFASQQVGTVVGHLFLALIIGTVIMVGLSIAGYNLVYKTHIDVMEYISRIAQYSNYNLLIALVTLLLALMGVSQIIIILALAMLLVFTVATLVPVLADGEGQGDKVLGALLTIAGLLIAIIIFWFLFRSAVQSIIGSFTSNLNSMFH